MAELVYAYASGAYAARLESSNLSAPTKMNEVEFVGASGQLLARVRDLKSLSISRGAKRARCENCTESVRFKSLRTRQMSKFEPKQNKGFLRQKTVGITYGLLFVRTFLFWYNNTKQNFLIMKKKTKNKEVSKIAENVKRLKKEKGFSKSDLVRETGLDYHTIAKIENGKTPDPRINTVIKLAAALNKTLDQLVA